jgi:hypothetical protein
MLGIPLYALGYRVLADGHPRRRAIEPRCSVATLGA